MSYTFLNALQSLWKPHEKTKKIMSSWKDYAEAHKTLQEEYLKKFSTNMKDMHEHLKKGDHVGFREKYKKQLEDVATCFESSLDKHLELFGADPSHAEKIVEHHHQVAQTLLEAMPLSKSLYEKMHEHPSYKRSHRLMKKMSLGTVGVLAGLMASVVPTKSADANVVATMRMGDPFDVEQAFRARDTVAARSQRVVKAGPAKMTREMEEAVNEFMINLFGPNPDWLQDLAVKKNEEKRSGEVKSIETPIPLPSSLPVFEDKNVSPQVKSIETLIPSPPPLPVFEDKNVRPQVKASYIDVLKELKDKFSEKNKRLFQNKDIKNLNQLAHQLEKTATGSYLKFMYPGQDMETALARAVGNMLQLIQKDAKSKNRIASEGIIQALKDDYQGVKKEVIGLTREILKSSVAYGPDYTVFYHGHGNSLRLYLDMLREIKGYENISDLQNTNPLRDKGRVNTVNNARDLLEQYEDQAIEFQKRANAEAKAKDPTAKELNLFDDNRTLGVGFAPDKIDFFRDHAISANINLFGNMHVLAECTLFYFLDSFNISNPNEFLVKNLLSRITPSDAPEGYVEARMKRYSDLYNTYMKDTGGNLMQIFMKNTPDGETGKNLVDEMTFPAWMKGIPIWESRDTGKIATVTNNFDAVPVLSNKNKLFKEVKTSSYVDLFTKDPNKFIDKYSNFSKLKKVTKRNRLASLDRPQVRIFVDPATFNDGRNVIVEQHVRKNVSDQAAKEYQDELQKLIREDMNIYLEGLQKDTVKGSEGDRLTKLIDLMKEGQAFEEANKAYGEKPSSKKPSTKKT